MKDRMNLGIQHRSRLKLAAGHQTALRMGLHVPREESFCITLGSQRVTP